MEPDARQASVDAQGGRSNVTRATFDGVIRKAFSSQSTLLGRAEHCSLDPRRLASVGLVVGTQLRVARDSGQLAVYTVSETRQEAVDATIRMALSARQRLGTSEEFDASIDTRVPHPTFSDAEARAHSEFVERLDDNGRQAGLVALAPHGGAIERRTDQQAERVAAILGSDRASVWCCKGFNTGGGAYERWHVTSTDIHEVSFPLLTAIVGRGFAQAVSFHGFSEAGVLVGGTAPGSFKQEIAAALECALIGSGIEVRVARASEEYDGDNPRNIVNRLSANGANGVQIEQSLEAREGFWQPIAEAVASVYRQGLPRQIS